MKLNQKLIFVILVTAVVAAGAGFLGGTKYQQNQRSSFTAQGGNFRINGNTNGQTQMFRPVQGEIISSDNTSITVKLDDGSTKIVLFSDSTAINKAENGSKSDLTTGQIVLVTGQTNSDGSVTAQNIQLNPQTGIMFRGEPGVSTQP